MDKEKETEKSEQGETSKVADFRLGRGELPPLYVPHATSLNGGHLSLQYLGILEDQDEEVLDLTKITFDEINLKIIQERKKYCNRNPVDPLSVTTTTYIMPNIMINP